MDKTQETRKNILRELTVIVETLKRLENHFHQCSEARLALFTIRYELDTAYKKVACTRSEVAQ